MAQAGKGIDGMKTPIYEDLSDALPIEAIIVGMKLECDTIASSVYLTDKKVLFAFGCTLC